MGQYQGLGGQHPLTEAKIEDNIAKALEELRLLPRDRWNVKATAEKYYIPRGTLRYRIDHAAWLGNPKPVTEIHTHPSNRTILPLAIEKALYDHICSMADIGFAMDWTDIKLLARRIACDMVIPDFKASKGWLRRFKARYPSIRRRLCENFDNLRAGGMNPTMVTKYFDLLQSARDKVKALSGGIALTPDRIHNMDETGFDRGLDNRWAVAPAHKRPPRCIEGVQSFHVTMVNCITASGTPCDPIFILPAKRKPKLSENKLAPDGRLKGVNGERTAYCISESGFLTMDIWEECIVPFLCQEISHANRGNDGSLWNLLILDGVGAHTMSPKGLKYFWDNKIYVIKMPAHTSADLQPLDKAVFHAVKAEARGMMRSYILDSSIYNGVLDPWDIAHIFERSWFARATESNIRSGFRSCGIEPLNMAWVFENDDKFKTSIAFMQDLPDDRHQLSPQVFAKANNERFGLPMLAIQSIMRFACDETTASCCKIVCKTVRCFALQNLAQSGKVTATAPAGPTPSRPLKYQAATIEEALKLHEINSCPNILKRVLDDDRTIDSLCNEIRSTQNQDLVQRDIQNIKRFLLMGLGMGVAVLQHYKTPLLLSKAEGVLSEQRNKRRRTNAIGERESMPLALNEPSRTDALQVVRDERTAQESEKVVRKRSRTKRFLEEKPLVDAIRSAGIIGWSADEHESFQRQRLLTRTDITRFIRHKEQHERFRVETGTALSTATREVLARFALSHLSDQVSPTIRNSGTVAAVVSSFIAPQRTQRRGFVGESECSCKAV